jgi:hypothetical protein
METEILHNANSHFEYVQWKSELNFWNNELDSFKNRLSELVTRWTDKDLLAQLQYYQNEFILHGDVLEEILEIIKKHEKTIFDKRNENHESMSIYMENKHLELRDKMEAQRQVYADLKKKFFIFLSKDI